MITRAQVVQIEPPAEKWGERIGENRQKIMVPGHGMFVISTSWLRSTAGKSAAWKVSTLVLPTGSARSSLTMRLPDVTDHETAIAALLDKINKETS